MLKYIIFAGNMFFNTLNPSIPESNPVLETSKSELELIIDKVKTLGKGKTVDYGEGTRYKYELPGKVTIQGTEYNKVVISYIDFKNEDKNDRLAVTLVDLSNSDLKILSDGEEKAPDGIPDMEVDLENISIYKTAKLLLLRKSNSSDLKSMFKEDLKKVQESNKAYFHEAIDKFLYENNK